jgi:hypothetical protein
VVDADVEIVIVDVGEPGDEIGTGFVLNVITGQIEHDGPVIVELS